MIVLCKRRNESARRDRGLRPGCDGNCNCNGSTLMRQRREPDQFFSYGLGFGGFGAWSLSAAGIADERCDETKRNSPYGSCTRARLGVFCRSPFDGRLQGGGHLEPLARVSSGGCPRIHLSVGPRYFIRTDHDSQLPSLYGGPFGSGQLKLVLWPKGSALRRRSVVHALVLRCDPPCPTRV